MPRYTSPVDGAQLYYRDYKPICNGQANTGTKPALVFLHGWPYSSLAWETLTVQLCENHGFRCIAPDRRGFGKSDWDGPQSDTQITYETFAEDTVHLLEKFLDVGPFVFITSSMGAGESILALEASDYLWKNCKGLIWVAPALPGKLPGEDNRTTGPKAVWDDICAGFQKARADFVHAALPGVIVGTSELTVSPEVLRQHEKIVEDADGLAIQRCAHIVREADFNDQLLRFKKDSSVPILCVHGDSDQGAPYEKSTKLIKEIIPRVQVELYEQAAHALNVTHAERLLNDVLKFVQA
ncbi:hypothetical protein PMG11_08697 [Penicillium brasilianum]|uniref:AB hydrolase-1 domain-containing protein n=1 Tax=Penicillium brasilianum TaxID=104259 RepID=A0A0F7TW45_PENBI|nr:hypothetical protein PMG11_08697 [Penicillium brasilianum]